MQQDHPQTSGRLPERHRLRRRYGEPRGVPFIRSGKGSAAAKRGRSDPFRLRAAHGRKRRAYSEKEAAIELLLEAKGFNDVVASVAEDSVDIVINQQTLENSQKAQIEDIAKRKTGVTSDKITINVIK